MLEQLRGRDAEMVIPDIPFDPPVGDDEDDSLHPHIPECREGQFICVQVAIIEGENHGLFGQVQLSLEEEPVVIKGDCGEPPPIYQIEMFLEIPEVEACPVRI